MHVVVVALALQVLTSATAEAPREPTAPPVPLAQAGERPLDEDFGDPPPPPPALDGGEDGAPIGEAPPLPPPTLDEGREAPPPAPAAPRTADPPAAADDGASSPLLTRALQYAAGLGTITVCAGLGGLGVALSSPCLLAALQPFAFTLPLLAPLVAAAALVSVGAGSGAAAGAVEGLVGDALGEEEGGLLWPTLAAAGTGAALVGAATGSALASQLVANTPAYQLNPLVPRIDTPVSCVFASSACLFAGLFCVGTPLAGVLAYGAVATPSAPAAVVSQPSPLPALPTFADRGQGRATMAF